MLSRSSISCSIFRARLSLHSFCHGLQRWLICSALPLRCKLIAGDGSAGQRSHVTPTLNGTFPLFLMASVQSHLELSEYRKQQARGDQAPVPDLVTAVILTCFLFPADHKPRNATVSRVLHFFRCPGWCGEQGTVAFSSGEGASAAQISGWVHRLHERKFSNCHASRTAPL